MSRYAVYIHVSLLDIAPKKGIQRELLMASSEAWGLPGPATAISPTLMKAEGHKK